MKVLVTGADGILGNNLVRELLSRHYDVSVMLFNKSLASIGLIGLPVNRYYGNILDKQALDNAIINHDIVIHAAADTRVYPAYNSNIRAVNVTGTSNVIESCLKHNVNRLIHIGTANSFAPGSKEKPGDENDVYNGFKYGLSYMDSKFEAQQLILNAFKNSGLDACIINPTFMLGPYDSKPSSGQLIIALFKNKLPIYPPGSRSYVAVKDASIAIANSISRGQSGECYILANDNLSYKEIFDIIGESIGINVPRYTLPKSIIKLYGTINSLFGKISGNIPTMTRELAVISCENHCYSGKKAKKELRLPHTSPAIAIKECFEWFQANGYV